MSNGQIAAAIMDLIEGIITIVAAVFTTKFLVNFKVFKKHHWYVTVPVWIVYLAVKSFVGREIGYGYTTIIISVFVATLFAISLFKK